MTEETVKKRLDSIEDYIKEVVEEVLRLKTRDEDIASVAVQTKEALRQFGELKREISTIKMAIKRQRNSPLKGPW